ncbi:glycosyltransferase family 4 protein [bacterium]
MRRRGGRRRSAFGRGKRVSSRGPERIRLSLSGRPLKILFIEPWGKGGAQHYVHSLANAVSEHGMDVGVLTSNHCDIADLPRTYQLHDYVTMWDFEELPTFSFIEKWRRRLKRYSVYSAFWDTALKTVRETRPDIVHFQDVVFEIDYQFIRKIARTGVVTGDTVHNVLPFGEGGKAPEDVTRRHPWVLWQRRRIYSLFDFLLFHSDGGRNDFIRYYGDNYKHLDITMHGEFTLYEKSKLSKEEARRKAGLPPDAPVLLSFGAIRKYKGLDIAIKTLAAVREHVPDTMLLVAGNIGSDVDMESYYELAKHLGVAEAILWRLEYIPNEEVGDLYAAADIALLTHRMVYQSGVQLLAWHFGTPMVASSVGGLAEMIESGRTGIMFPDGDHKSAADACINIINHPELAGTLVEEGKRTGKERHSWRATAGKLEKIYSEAIDRRGGNTGSS